MIKSFRDNFVKQALFSILLPGNLYQRMAKFIHLILSCSKPKLANYCRIDFIETVFIIQNKCTKIPYEHLFILFK